MSRVPPSTSTRRIIIAVIIGQSLFTAGNALTVGGFFNYFANSFAPSATLLALLQIIPETSQSLSVFGREIALVWPNRKRVWLTSLLLARMAALLVPAALLLDLRASKVEALGLILVGTVLWYALQGIAYVNYISWLSDLVPDTNWGRLFARWKITQLVITCVMSVGVSQLRARLLAGLPSDAERWSYVVIFAAGGILCMLSVIPLLNVPNVPLRQPASRSRDAYPLDYDRSSFRWLLSARWCLAFFQGLTQTVLFKYVCSLGVQLDSYQVLLSAMLVSQIPVTWLAGRISDRSHDKAGLIWGISITALGMTFILIATPNTTWPLLGTYLAWSAFGLVNVCGRNLCLKIAPTGNNLRQFALYTQASGLIAGGAGLLGALVFGRMTQSSDGQSPHMVYQALFLVSMMGRLLAAFWLLPVRQPLPCPTAGAPSEKVPNDLIETEPDDVVRWNRS